MIIISDTLFIGKVLYSFPSLPSTNQFALDLVSKSKPSEGSVVFTAYQTAGRGQIGSRWVVLPNLNVTMSVVLYPKFLEVQQQFLLNKVVALAVREVVEQLLRETGKRVTIKWSNDIYVENEKIAGILIQNGIQNRFLQYSVMGIGLNVNQVWFDAALLNPTSLKLQAGRDFELEGVLQLICQKIEHYYLQLKFGHFDRLNVLYLRHLYRYQERAWYQRLDGTVFQGVIMGVSPTGQLQLFSEHIETFDLKEIKFIQHI